MKKSVEIASKSKETLELFIATMKEVARDLAIQVRVKRK
jgi:glucokinase